MVMNLLSFLDNSAGARLVFGKKELEIIHKQLLGMRLKQSERNRLSKFIRPKLRFIAECSVFKNEFVLARRSKLKKVLTAVLGAVLEDRIGKNAVAVLLYGSFADGTANKFSDVDIAIVFSEITHREASAFEVRVGAKLPELVDLKVFNVLPLRVKKSLVANYKVLYKTRDFNEDFWFSVIKNASESRALKTRRMQWKEFERN